jgi:hypothetical protein
MPRRYALITVPQSRATPTQNRLSYLAALTLITLSLAACTRHPSAARSRQSTPHGGNSAPGRLAQFNGPILKIAVMRDGRLFVDGNITQLPALRDSLERLKDQKGCVYYYREAGWEKPASIATKVIQAIVDARLPIRLSTRSDYSDAVGP